ncbi:MAG: hypothetical protein K0R62_4570 [Nonomuraea muscovyensis]|nr:hypothetical protein [Nonomuraea muscovyensis]
MVSTQRLILLSATLVAASALAPAAASQSSAATGSARTAATNVSPATPSPEEMPKEYWSAYKKGYGDAKDCDKGAGFSYDGTDWDRKGWVDGYNAGHERYC